MQDPVDLGRPYTTGPSFRARAEARQRDYRAWKLRADWAEWGHMLAPEAAAAGANFAVPQAFAAAKARMAQGKGVNADRTTANMLSSQAMCFNLFTPLAMDPGLAQRVLSRFVPALGTVRKLAFEYTPAPDVFGDQSGVGGVDCDLLVEGLDLQGLPMVLTLETKFVEPEFSRCGYRKSERRRKNLPMCPKDVVLDAACSNCLYVSTHGYKYWQRTQEVGNLLVSQLPAVGCAFGGPLWQLWVNHTLAHVESQRRGGTRAVFAVCAPAANAALLDGGRTLDSFRALLRDPESFAFIDLNALLLVIDQECRGRGEWHTTWAGAIQLRYGQI